MCAADASPKPALPQRKRVQNVNLGVPEIPRPKSFSDVMRAAPEQQLKRLDIVAPANVLDTDAGEPPHSEHVLIYSSYARQTPTDAPFEALVRGCVFYTQLNRKGKLMVAAVEKLVGLPPKEDEEPAWRMFAKRRAAEDVLQEMKEDKDIKDQLYERRGSPKGGKHAGRTDSGAPVKTPQELHALRKELKATVRARLQAVAQKAAALRDVMVVIESRADANGHARRRTFWTTTDDSGRFVKACRVPFRPQRVYVTCGLAHESAALQFVPKVGVSVISDIDDTVRHTGVTRGKRELLQNVFAKSFQDCRLEGVSEWYNRLKKCGAHFHYVSNSPWQLYDVINGFLKHHDFPEGSIHLKRYAGVFDELTEPARTRKKSRLEQIVRHFPGHKFILVGDSGEADLESYADLARAFPNNVAAIYIRDIEKHEPEHEYADQSLHSSHGSQSVHGTEGTHDMHNKHISQSVPGTPVSTPLASRNPSLEEVPTISKFSPPPPPLPARVRTTPAEEARSASSQLRQTQSFGDPPRLPPRPRLLRRTSSKIMEGLTTVKSAARLFPHGHGHPHSQSSGNLVEGHNAEVLRRKSQPILQLDDELFVPSSQEFDFDHYERTNKRAELWKLRVAKQRRLLPEGVELRTWRTPEDVEEDSIELVTELQAAAAARK